MNNDLENMTLHAIDLLVQQGRVEHIMIDGKPAIKLIENNHAFAIDDILAVSEALANGDNEPAIRRLDPEMDSDLDIPEFLKRDKSARPQEGTPAASNNATVPAVKPDAEQEKWRVMEEQRREHRKAKARARVGKMLAVKADREALAAGKTWNTIKGQWE